MKVPFFWQDTEYTCGPASLQMVLAFFSKRVSEERLARGMCTTKSIGTKRSDFISKARREGFFCYVNSGSSLNEIGHYLSLGSPVIVNILSENEGHYAVVVGVTRKNVILHDPYYGAHKRWSHRTFNKNWKGERGQSSKWMMVLSPGDFNLGRQYYPLG